MGTLLKRFLAALPRTPRPDPVELVETLIGLPQWQNPHVRGRVLGLLCESVQWTPDPAGMATLVRIFGSQRG